MIKVVPHGETWRGAVRHFNARMAAAGGVGFFEDPIPDWLAPGPDLPTHRELFVAVGEDDLVHGGYVLRHERGIVAGDECSFASVQGPYSEGAVDSRHARTSFAIIRDMSQRQPLLYGWGLERRPDVRSLFGAFGWRGFPSPTLLWWGVPFSRRSARFASGVTVAEEPDFGGWADEVWQRCARRYSFVPARDRRTLRTLYPPDAARFHRLVVRVDGAVAGWAVVGLGRLRRHPMLGRVTLGVLWDCFGAPQDARFVAGSAHAWLRRRGSGVVLASLSHPAWSAGLLAQGFRPRGHDRYLLASPALVAALARAEPNGPEHFLTFGDGEGHQGSLGREVFGAG